MFRIQIQNKRQKPLVLCQKCQKMLTYDQKVLAAQMVFDEKDILFGEFGPDLSKVEKQEKWMEILVKLNSIGANVSDYKSLRDVEWSNMKRATEKKVATLKSNEEKNEDEKVQCKPLSPLDEIVLDILGKGKGLTRKSSGLMDDPSGLGPLMKYDEDSEGSEADFPLSANIIPPSKKRKRGHNKGRHFALNYPLSANHELMELRRKKLTLECAKLELELEKIPLECAKLELEIQLLQRDLYNNVQHQQHNTNAANEPQ